MALLMYPKVKTVLYIDGITHVPESQDCIRYQWHYSCTRKSRLYYISMALLMYPKVKTVLYIDGITHVPESQDCIRYQWHYSCTRKSRLYYISMALLMYPKVKTVLYIDGIAHVPESQTIFMIVKLMKNLKIPNWKSEAVNQRTIYTTMAKDNMDKRQIRSTKHYTENF